MNKQWPIVMLVSSIGLITLLCTSTLAIAEAAEQDIPTVEIDKEVHFLTPEGKGVRISPGVYEVQADPEGLRLIAPTGMDMESIVIDARDTAHQETISTPMALSFSEKDDEHVVVLLLPEGKSLEALGSYSGVHKRAARRAGRSAITSARLKKEFFSKKRPRHYQRRQLMLATASVYYPTLKQTYRGIKGRTRMNAWQLPVNDVLTTGTFIFTWADYQGKTSSKTLPRPDQIPEIGKLVGKQQCCIKLLINGIPAKRVEGGIGRAGNLVTRVKLTQPRAKHWPKTIQLIITHREKKWESSPTKVFAIAQSYYAAVLHPIFSHPRCTICHSLGDRDAIVAMHQNRGMTGEGASLNILLASPPPQPQNHTSCRGCHWSRVQDWRSPNFAQGLNWFRKTAEQVCNIVTGPFTNKDGVTEPPFDHDKFDHHFHEDPRILWAVSDGWVPHVDSVLRDDFLDVPFKNDPQAWFNKVDPWVDAGAPCPKSTFTHYLPRTRKGIHD